MKQKKERVQSYGVSPQNLRSSDPALRNVRSNSRSGVAPPIGKKIGVGTSLNRDLDGVLAGY